MKWETEHGAGYAVPAEIISAGLPDVSWHNDACPAFGSQANDTDYCLWVEHPDPDQRELDGGRFSVTTANGEFTVYNGDDIEAALAAYFEATGTTPVAERLAEQDKAGQPYTPLHWTRMDYAQALAIARSKHPSRVLANTHGYRFGKFTEHAGIGSTEVRVHLIGQHIATFTPEGVFLWSRGYVTVTTSEALSALVTGGYFYHEGGVLYFSAYETTGDRRTGTRHSEGSMYPYKIKEMS